MDYYSLGKLFDISHDRAIRYYTEGKAKKAVASIPQEPTRINIEYCAKCDCYHILRSVRLITKE